MPVSDDQLIEGIKPHDLIPAPWTVDAACADADPAVFFIDHGRPAAPAKAICAGCPVRAECLDFALASRACGWPCVFHGAIPEVSSNPCAE